MRHEDGTPFTFEEDMDVIFKILPDYDKQIKEELEKKDEFYGIIGYTFKKDIEKLDDICSHNDYRIAKILAQHYNNMGYDAGVVITDMISNDKYITGIKVYNNIKNMKNIKYPWEKKETK